MSKVHGVAVFLCGIAISGLAMAECPHTMPLQLLEDCIVYENAETDFPPSDYANLALYKEWMEKQKSTAEISTM